MNKLSKIVFVSIVVILLAFIVIYGFIDDSKNMKIINDIMDEADTATTETMVYVGSSECEVCEYQAPEMSILLDNFKFTYYYVDMASIPTKSETSKFITRTGYDTSLGDFSTPSIFIYKNGKIVDQLIGLNSTDKIFNTLKSNGIINTTKDLPIKYLSLSSYMDLIEEDDISVLALGSAGSEGSNDMEKIMWDIANDYDVDINFLQLYNLSEDEGNVFEKSLSYFDSNNLVVPSVLIIKNGEVISSLTQLQDSDSYIAFFTENDIIKEEVE